MHPQLLLQPMGSAGSQYLSESGSQRYTECGNNSPEPWLVWDDILCLLGYELSLWAAKEGGSQFMVVQQRAEIHAGLSLSGYYLFVVPSGLTWDQMVLGTVHPQTVLTPKELAIRITRQIKGGRGVKAACLKAHRRLVAEPGLKPRLSDSVWWPAH